VTLKELKAKWRDKRRTSENRMCTGKKASRFKDGARQQLERVLALPGTWDRERLEVYCCLYCWNWHIGHAPKN
jgi:hypothetical protein